MANQIMNTFIKQSHQMFRFSLRKLSTKNSFRSKCCLITDNMDFVMRKSSPQSLRLDQLNSVYFNQIIIRHKYSSTKVNGSGGGVKGIKGKKYKTPIKPENEDDNDDVEDTVGFDINIDDSDYDNLANTAMHVTKNILNEQSVFIIQPYIKWGPNKSQTSPQLKLQEAEALVRSLPNWSICQSLTVPLDTLDKRSLFGSGKLEEIRQSINRIRNSGGSKVSCVFISKGTLTATQKQHLEKYFNVSIMDRYSVVIQILRLHATSNEAKLQVAMAEIPYIWSQLRGGGGGAVDGEAKSGSTTFYAFNDSQKQLLRNREKKLKTELANIRQHRELLRNKRKQKNFPVIAIVGYTNAGKTSLIKALTNEETIQPRNQLFATLDVTAHAGLLPSNLKVIYMDTVGFMSDIPTGLIECFVATLEDAMLADLIIHVHDVSHENYQEQREHVEKTLKSLLKSTGSGETDDEKHMEKLLSTIINVGNKMDLINEDKQNIYNELNLISSKYLIGIDELLCEIENGVLKATNRHKIIIKVPMGGQEASWLYKNSAVTDTMADPKNSQNLMLNVVISDAKLKQFRHYFVKNLKSI